MSLNILILRKLKKKAKRTGSSMNHLERQLRLQGGVEFLVKNKKKKSEETPEKESEETPEKEPEEILKFFSVKGKSTIMNEYELKKRQDREERKKFKNHMYLSGKLSKRTGKGTGRSNKSRNSGKSWKKADKFNASVRKTIRTRDNGPKRRSQKKKVEAARFQKEKRIANKKAEKAKDDAEAKAEVE